MPLTSAGVLLYRHRGADLEVLLVHPGGPFWRHKDAGAWMIPKGGIEPGENAEQAARREFEEELGASLAANLIPLCRVRQSGGKWVEAFAGQGEFDPERLVSNSFEMEWPPRSGQRITVPEVDRAQWFGLGEAREKMLPSQVPILNALVETLAGGHR
jgi:predicted NUDIX family NTP pyrophosphohydrolase